MGDNTPDYKDNLFFEPRDPNVKTDSEIIDELKLKLYKTEKECNKVKKQLEVVIEGLKKYESGTYNATDASGCTHGFIILANDRGRTARIYLDKINQIENEYEREN